MVVGRVVIWIFICGCIGGVFCDADAGIFYQFWCWNWMCCDIIIVPVAASGKHFAPVFRQRIQSCLEMEKIKKNQIIICF